MHYSIRRTALASCAAILATFAVGAANATTISFAMPSGPLGVSRAYGPVTAYGFTAPTSGSNKGKLTAHDLFGKNGVAGETGLGLDDTRDSEINTPTGSEAIVLDIRALQGLDLQIGFGSVQPGEGFRIGFSDSATLPSNESAFSEYLNGTTDFPKTLDLGTNNDNFLIAEATSGNVLLTSLSYNNVPEPASMALLGMGLAGLAMSKRRRAV